MHSGVWAQELEISVGNSFKGFSYNGDVAERTMRSIDCFFFFYERPRKNNFNPFRRKYKVKLYLLVVIFVFIFWLHRKNKLSLVRIFVVQLSCHVCI